MKFVQYPSYQDSEVEWLGRIPKSWCVQKVKYIAGKIGSGKTPLGGSEVYTSEGILFLRSQNVYDDGLRLEDVAYISEKIDADMTISRVKPNDVLLNITGASIGRCCVYPKDAPHANVNQHVCIVRSSDNISPIYLAYALKSLNTKNQIFSGENGTSREGLTFQQVGDLSFTSPIPLNEQIVIANFLDHETAKIDTLIAKQQRLIELLQEKRQALISHAVTKGLNPDALMKDSGIEWIGEVPEHWEISRFGRELQRIETGWTPDSEQRLAEDHEWAVLKVGCIRNGNFYEEEHKALLPDVIPLPELEVRAGDLLMSRANTTELVGSVGLIRKTKPNLTLSDKTFRLILKDSILPEYANALLQAKIARIQIELAATGASSSMKNISQESIRAMKLPVPPVNEQKEILSLLNNELAKIEQLIQKTQQAIALSNERRSSLISAAVTGKIDVRGYNTTPESSYEPETQRNHI